MATEKGVKVANAVVAVIPSFEGAREAIGTKLMTSVTGAADKAGDAAGKKIGGKLSDGLSTAKIAIGNAIGNIVTGAVTKLSGAIKDTFTQAFSNYGDYQQLVGGVETLFKNSAGIVQNYAKNAYKTAGLSANDYMETVTGFSASLIASLGGDTEKAARIADLAMVDMSDNANKMGTAIGSIQYAYQGFAKQNYTMLDNLKLGYGGTKQEMQRLLDDANALNAAQGKVTNYSLENFSDIVEAIHVIQENIGITGTTAEEAGSTIQGAIGMANAAWQNFLTGLADPNADMQALSKNLIESLATAFSNVAPAIKQMFVGAFEGLKDVLREAGLGGVSDFLDGVQAALQGPVFQGIIQTVSDIGAGIIGAFNSPEVQAALDAVFSLFGEIANSLGGLFNRFAPSGEQISEIIKVIAGAISWLAGVIETIWPTVYSIISFVGEVGGTVLGALWEILQAIGEVIAEVGAAILEEMAPGLEEFGEISLSNILDAIKNIVGFAKDLVLNVLSWVKDNAPAIGEMLGKIGNVILKVISVIGPLLSAIFDFIFGAVNAILDFFTNDPIGQTIVNILGGLLDIIGSIIGAIVDLISWVFGLLGDSLADADANGRNVFQALGEFIARLIGGIADFIGGILNNIASAIQNVVKDICQVIADTLNNIAKGIQDAVFGFCDFIANAISDMVDNVINAGKGILDFFAGIPQQIIDFFAGIPDAIAGVFSNIHIPTFHVDGEFNLDPANFKLPSISFYAEGGWVGRPTAIAGEAGNEVVLSERGKFTNRFAGFIANALESRGIGGDTYFVIDGAVINSDEEMERNFYNNMMDIKRKAGMYV